MYETGKGELLPCSSKSALEVRRYCRQWIIVWKRSPGTEPAPTSHPEAICPLSS